FDIVADFEAHIAKILFQHVQFVVPAPRQNRLRKLPFGYGLRELRQSIDSIAHPSGKIVGYGEPENRAEPKSQQQRPSERMDDVLNLAERDGDPHDALLVARGIAVGTV